LIVITKREYIFHYFLNGLPFLSEKNKVLNSASRAQRRRGNRVGMGISIMGMAMGTNSEGRGWGWERCLRKLRVWMGMGTKSHTRAKL